MDSPDADKLQLCQGTIENFRSISQRTWVVGSCISCTVYNYLDLPNCIYYTLTRIVSDSKFTLKVLKKKLSHFIQLHCPVEEDLVFHVVYDKGKFSMTIIPVKTEYGFWVEVSREVMLDSRNRNLLVDNCLIVDFQYCSSFYAFSRTPLSLCGRRELDDEERFSRDMLKLYRRRKATADFSIVVQGEEYPIHKFLLSARSNCFQLNPNSWGRDRICIIGEPLVMDNVIRYMYCGVLRGTDVDGMLKILEIAFTLGVTGLAETVKVALMKMVTEDNAVRVFRTAEKLSVEDLKMHASSFLRSPVQPQRRGAKASHKRKKSKRSKKKSC